MPGLDECVYALLTDYVMELQCSTVKLMVMVMMIVYLCIAPYDPLRVISERFENIRKLEIDKKIMYYVSSLVLAQEFIN